MFDKLAQPFIDSGELDVNDYPKSIKNRNQINYKYLISLKFFVFKVIIITLLH